MSDVLRDFQLAMRNVDLWLVLGEHRNCRCLACENLRQLLLKWQGEECDRLDKERLSAALALSEEYHGQKDEQIERLQTERNDYQARLESTLDLMHDAETERDHMRQVIRAYVGQQLHYGCPDDACLEYRALFHAAAGGNGPEPCRPDTDGEDPAYPATANDYLHLLGAYWCDVLPDELIPDDEYFALWERCARPVIERVLLALSAAELREEEARMERDHAQAERDEFRKRCRQWRDELLALCCVGNSQQVHLALTRIQFDMLDWVGEKQDD